MARAGSGVRAAEPDARRAQRRREAQANGAGERDTKRVVLRRERVLVLPEGVEPGSLDELLKAVRKHGRIVEGDGWLVVGEFDGDTPRRAIEAHAGKPGTPDAKPGVYKAPTVKAWKGGRRYEKPELPKVEAEDID